MSAIRKALKLPITAPLRFGFVRRRVAYELRPWFGEMEFEIPLGDGLACPIRHWDSVHSFSEIFVTNEYGTFLEEAPLPFRWLDVGCHVGYFTLFLAWKNALAGRAKEWSALMIDADPRVEAPVRWMLQRNGLEENGMFMPGMIGEGEFALRDGMGSSSEVKPGEKICRVPCVTAEEISKGFAGPYDLIKIDIEGAEYEFLRGYGELCRQAEWLLIEWHGENGDEKLRALCGDNGFEYVKEVRAERELFIDGTRHSSGVVLYRRK